MLASLGQQTAQKRETWTRTPKAEDGCTGPPMRNASAKHSTLADNKEHGSKPSRPPTPLRPCAPPVVSCWHRISLQEQTAVIHSSFTHDNMTVAGDVTTSHMVRRSAVNNTTHPAPPLHLSSFTTLTTIPSQLFYITGTILHFNNHLPLATAQVHLDACHLLFGCHSSKLTWDTKSSFCFPQSKSQLQQNELKWGKQVPLTAYPQPGTGLRTNPTD